MQRLQSFGIYLSSLLASGFVLAEGPVQRNITLEECIQLALRNNLDIQAQRYLPQIDLLNLRGLYAAYEPNFSFSVEHSSSTSPGGYAVGIGDYPGSDSDTDTVRGSLGGALPWGMSYSLGASLGDNYGTSTTPVTVGTNTFLVVSPFESTRGQLAAVELRQALLRDSWIDPARYQIALSKLTLKVSEHAVRQQIITTLAAVEQSYYLLISSFEQVKVQEKAVELAEKLLAENRKRVEVGSMAPLDEKQAESSVAARKADLIRVRKDLAVAQNTLKSLVTDQYMELHGVELVPTVRLAATPVVLDLQASWVRGLSYRPELLQTRANLERYGITLSYDKNQFLPNLDIVGTVGYNASADEFSRAIGQWTDRDAPFASVRLEFSMPLGNTSARNTYRANKARKEQALLQLRQLEQQVLIEIDNAITDVRTSLEQVHATREARVYAEAALDAEVKKMENGKSTSFIVLQLQNDLTSARFQEIGALATYNIALAKLAQSESSTLERHKLDVMVR